MLLDKCPKCGARRWVGPKWCRGDAGTGGEYLLYLCRCGYKRHEPIKDQKPPQEPTHAK